jgi:hypothetical protein
MVAREQDDNAAEKLSEVAQEAGAQPDSGDAKVPPDSTGYSAPPLDAPETP